MRRILLGRISRDAMQISRVDSSSVNFARQHMPLNIATIETIKRFVQKRVGLAFVPRMCVREELDRGALVSVPVRGLTHNSILLGGPPSRRKLFSIRRRVPEGASYTS